MGLRGVKPVWEICEPHRDVFSRDPDPSLFAISLHHVACGDGDRDYTDAERFFARTFMTRALENLLERVIGRLAGRGSGAPILRLETAFGGGKTHTMTALLHIARSPQELSSHEAIQPILERLGLRALPGDIRVAVLDGRGLNVRGRSIEGGLTVKTLWGELAYQVGGREGYAMLADADQTCTSPGAGRLTEFLKHYQPVLVLMDEVLEYLIKARAVKVGDSSLMEQTGTFLGDLTAAVSAVPQSVLTVSLPASSLEVPTESKDDAERFFQFAKKIFGRVELVETPVAEDEVFGVLRRRLFQSVGTERDAKKAVDLLRSYYDRYAHAFPDRVLSPDYKERMLRAYPFHPEVVDLLYERWGPHPQFQRTRGALRLLALVIRNLWTRRPGSAFMIQPHHIALSDRHIRGEIVRLLDSSWESIVTGDVLDRAAKLEQELGGDYMKEQLGVGAATCAFLYSISAGMQHSGATEEEIRMALLRPDINPAMATEVLGRMREQLWYLRYRDRRYLFSARPNLNKVILDFEGQISDDSVTEALERRLGTVAGRGMDIFQMVIAPESPENVPDRAQPTLVLLPLEVEDPLQWMKRAMQSAADRIRANRNMLIFVVPESAKVEALRSVVRRLVALEQVAASPSFREMDREDQLQVKEQFKDKEAELEGQLRQVYRRVFRPGDPEPVEIRGSNPDAIKATTLDEFVKGTLDQAGVLFERLAPEYLAETLRLDEECPVPLSQVSNLLTGVVGQPVVANPAGAVQDAIRKGVQEGLFAVRVADRLYHREEVPPDVLNRNDVVLVRATEQVATPPPVERRQLQLRVRTSATQLYPLLLAAKENFSKLTEASLTVEVDDPTGELSDAREQLDRLLRQYGCTVEWIENGASE